MSTDATKRTNPRSPRDKELFALAKSGDNEARERFFKEHMGLMYYMTKEFEGCGLHQNDIFSEVQFAFLRAFESFTTEHKTSFSSYACICARNRVFDLFRRRKTHRTVSIHNHAYGEDESFEEILGCTDISLSELENKEFVGKVLKQYLEKGKRDDLLIMLQRLNGVDVLDVAANFGISRSTVWRTEKRVLEKLRLIANRSLAC